MNQGVGPELFAQRAAVDAEYASCLALVAMRVLEHGLEQRTFDFADDEVVEIAGAVAVQVPEILLERVFSVLVQRLALFRGLED